VRAAGQHYDFNIRVITVQPLLLKRSLTAAGPDQLGNFRTSLSPVRRL
jgi:hypothetical protein